MRKAFGGLKDIEIARKLRKSPSDVGKWTKRKALPRAEILIDVARITQCNLHWLLTGEGDADLNPLRFLDDRARTAVERVASISRQPVERVLADLTVEALTRRAAEMLENYRQLDGSQIDQLHAIMSLIDSPEDEAAAGNTRRASR